MTATQLLLTDAEQIDPLAETKAVIESAIRYVAIRDHGRVSSNAVRAHLAGRIPREHHKAVGQVYRALVARGLMQREGHEVSDDHTGGNAGRLIPTYRWTEMAA